MIARIAWVGTIMVLTSGLEGCYLSGPAVVPPPDFTNDAVPLRGAGAERRVEKFSASSRLVSLPEALRPQAEPRLWKTILLHHSATESGSVESIDAVHRQRQDSSGKPWLGIGYHFVIGNGDGMPDGLVEPTFRWRDQIHGAHAGQRMVNETAIGICLVGNFDEHPPTARQTSAARKLVQTLRRRFNIAADQVQGHREISASACPGRYFPLEKIANRKDVGYEPY